MKNVPVVCMRPHPLFEKRAPVAMKLWKALPVPLALPAALLMTSDI